MKKDNRTKLDVFLDCAKGYSRSEAINEFREKMEIELIKRKNYDKGQAKIKLLNELLRANDRIADELKLSRKNKQ